MSGVVKVSVAGRTFIDTTVTTAGAADAGKIPLLDGDGLLDASLLANAGGGGGVTPILKMLKTDAAGAITTTPAAITGLNAPVAASKTYLVEAKVTIKANANSDNSDWKFAVPAGATLSGTAINHPAKTGAPFATKTQQASYLTDGTVTFDSTTVWEAYIEFEFKGVLTVGGTAGNLQFLLSNHTAAEASAPYAVAGSFVRLTEVP